MASPAAKRRTLGSEVLFGEAAVPAGSPSLFDSEPPSADGPLYQLPPHWYHRQEACTPEDYQKMAQPLPREEISQAMDQQLTDMEGVKQNTWSSQQGSGVDEIRSLELKSQQISTEQDKEACSQGIVPQESTVCSPNYQDMQVCGYEDTNTVLTNADNLSQECCGEDEQQTPETETLRQLDGVLREQMNEEIEQFRSNLHSLLTDHYLRHRYFLNSGNGSTESAVPMNDSLCSSGSEACATSESQTSDSENRHGPSHVNLPATRPDQGQEEHQIQQYLISMLTSASIITNALRRKEYAV